MSRQSRYGFTLIELMIAVAIIGVLASVAIPAFNQYAMRAKASEGPILMQKIYTGLVGYWEQGRSTSQGIAATTAGHCITRECCGGMMQTIPPFPPGPEKRTGNWDHPEMKQIGFAAPGPVYPSFAWAVPDMASVSGKCGLSESDFTDQLAYIIFGITDLDGDGIYGGYSLQVGVRGTELFRQPGFSSLRQANVALGADCAPLCSDDAVE